MDAFGILFGMLAWIIAMVVWFAFCSLVKVEKRVKGTLSVLVVCVPPILGCCLLGWASYDEDQEDQFTEAVRAQNVRKVKSMLEHGHSPDDGREGDSPFEDAVLEGNVLIVQLLVAHGANVNSTSTQAYATPLMLAKREHNSQLVSILRQAGAKDSPNIAIVTTTDILIKEQPILLVIHDSDNDWYFLTSEPSEKTEQTFIAESQVFAIDPSLKSLSDLPVGWEAKRDTPTSAWIRSKHRNGGNKL